MSVDQENKTKSKTEVQAVLYAAIADAVAELRDNATATGQAEGLKHLAEAYAWVSNTSQPH